MAYLWQRSGAARRALLFSRARAIQTLAADSFEGNTGIIVIAATNRADILDPALLRPGRFDLVVEMPRPDQAGRRAIIGLHAARMPLGPDADLDALAAATAGLVGADLAGLCRRAALLAMAEADAPDAAVVGMRHLQTALAQEGKARRWTM